MKRAIERESSGKTAIHSLSLIDKRWIRKPERNFPKLQFLINTDSPTSHVFECVVNHVTLVASYYSAAD